MKTFYLKTTVILVLLAFSFISKAQVFVDGIVYDYTEDDQPIQVTVMEDDQFYQSIKTSKGGKFRLRLQPNHYYVINLSKPDHYITKIAVDTDLPFEPGPEFYTEIPLEADLVRKYIDLDPEVMKKPLSIFSYDPASETFIQDDDYLQKARAQLEAFLYEAEKAEKKGEEELSAETPEKSPEDTDDLTPETGDKSASVDSRQNRSRTGIDGQNENNKDTTLVADNRETEKDPGKASNNSTSLNNNRNAGGNNAGPSASRISNQNNPQIADTVNEDTTKLAAASSDSLEADTSNLTGRNYSISIKINGKTYNPNLNEAIEVKNDLEIEIAGIPKDDYSFFQYRLEGKDNDFRVLDDEDIEYDRLEKGNYTFILSNNSNNFEDINVPIKIIAEESDFPWLAVILGAVVLAVLIALISRRKKTDEDADDVPRERREV